METVELEDLESLTTQEKGKRQRVWNKLGNTRNEADRNVLNGFSRLPQFLTLDVDVLVRVIPYIAIKLDKTRGEEAKRREDVLSQEDDGLRELVWLYESMYNSRGK
jgi:hypothetical protein